MVCSVSASRGNVTCHVSKLSSLLSLLADSSPFTNTVTRVTSLSSSSAVTRIVSVLFSLAEITLGKIMLAVGGSVSFIVWTIYWPATPPTVKTVSLVVSGRLSAVVRRVRFYYDELSHSLCVHVYCVIYY